jgi:hypothetical protein
MLPANKVKSSGGLGVSPQQRRKKYFKKKTITPLNAH